MEAAKASATATAISSVETAAKAVEGIMKSDKPTAAGTKLVKVEQEIIDWLLTHPNHGESCGCFAPSPHEGTIIDALAEAALEDPELLEEVEVLRAKYEAAEAIFKKAHDMEEDILKQYKEKGCAMLEVDDEGRAVIN